MAHANMLITEIGFDGFRFDFVKGFGAWMIRSIHERQYVRGQRLVFPFGVGESWSSDGEIDAWLDEINRFTDNPISAFDFPLRYRLKEMCDSYGSSLRRLAEGGTVVAERPERAVTFVDNHDFRGGDAPPIINDKLMAYAFILTHPGYPCVFWRDYFEQGLGQPGSPRGIAALVGAHERNAAGEAIVRYVDDELYIMERSGWQGAPGLVFVLNNRGDRWGGSYVDTTRANTAFRPVAWWGRDDAAPAPDRNRGRPPRPILGPPARLRRLRPRLRPDLLSPARTPLPNPLPAPRGEGTGRGNPAWSLLPVCGEKVRMRVRWANPAPRPCWNAPRLRRPGRCASYRASPRRPRRGCCGSRRRLRRLSHRSAAVRGGRRAAPAADRPRPPGRRTRRGDRRRGRPTGASAIARASPGWRGLRRLRQVPSGRENLCPRATFTGWDVDGGYATQLTVRADFALRAPGRASTTCPRRRCCAAA